MNYFETFSKILDMLFAERYTDPIPRIDRQSRNNHNSRVMKAKRNKTIDIPVSEGGKYLKRCVKLKRKVHDIADIRDKTILGDIFKTAPLIPAASVDLLIADPPYNLTKTFTGNTFSKKKASDYGEYTREWLTAVLPLLKPEASVYVCSDWESSMIIGSVLKEFLTVRNRITWQREKGRGAGKNWKNGLEDIWFATVSDRYTFNLDSVRIRKKVIAPYRVDGKPKDWNETDKGNFRDTCPSNFWDDLTIPFWSMPENTAHPTQKPEKLMARIILASSYPGDLVFDPFLGSGTTSVTAKKLGRHYLGVETEEQYCVWAEKRLEDADSNKRIQGYENGVFWERNTRPLQ